MPTLYIIAGCNGAGKTTASMTLLPEILNCKEFVNADSIASGLSPFQPETVSFEAGRLMIRRMNELMKQGETFAVETTLSSRHYLHFIRKCREAGFKTALIFYWLSSLQLAKQRVKLRVLKGGHGIPNDVIERRYHKGLENFFSLYKNTVDQWTFLDNSMTEPIPIAQRVTNNNEVIFNKIIWNSLEKKYGR